MGIRQQKYADEIFDELKQDNENTISGKYFSFQIESDTPSDKTIDFTISASPSETYKISSIDGYSKETFTGGFDTDYLGKAKYAQELLPNYDFSIKYPKLYNLYQEIKEENLGV